MRLWELVNPSDYYTFVAEDPAIAGVCASLLSPTYFAKEIDGEIRTPLLMFANDVHTAWQSETGVPLDETLLRRAEIADCFDSFVVGDRKLYEVALSAIDDPEKRAMFIHEWNDSKTTSMNNIGAAAKRMAKHLRDLIASGERC